MLILPTLILVTLALLQLKHLVIDWVWQPAYEYQNKGIYGHFGGVRHALKNAVGTGLCVWLGFMGLATPVLCIWLAALDFTIHYHIDFFKTNANDAFALNPNRPQFWWMLGLDQTLHQLTYVFLVGYAAIVVF